MAVNASEPTSRSSRRSSHTSTTTTTSSSRQPKSPNHHSNQSNNNNSNTNTNSNNNNNKKISYTSNSVSGSGSEYRLNTSVATSSTSSHTSISSFRSSLPDNPQVYDFSDIRTATNNFLSKRYSTTSSSQSWRCNLHNKDVIIFQRKITNSISKSDLRSKLSVICRSHYKSIIKLLGATIYANHIYLVYEFVNGSNLALCLRNPNNPSYTVLSTWMSRMQIATDVAHGLDYIHNNTTAATGLDQKPVHKYVKSSGIIVTEPYFNAKICHFGAAELCNESTAPVARDFEGVRGYMSPEFQVTGVATQKDDVYAFGVVLLELFSGEEPVRYKYDKASGNYARISVMDTAREAVECGGDGGVERRLRKWIDPRLGDSFPVDVAEKVIRLALDCVLVEANDRPDMRRVAGKISKLYLESEFWSDRVKLPTEISVSLAPR